MISARLASVWAAYSSMGLRSHLITRRRSPSDGMALKAIRKGIHGVGPAIARHCQGARGLSLSTLPARAVIGQTRRVPRSLCVADRAASRAIVFLSIGSPLLTTTSGLTFPVLLGCDICGSLEERNQKSSVIGKGP